MKIFWLISRDWLEGSYSSLECSLPCIKANFIVNLVPFGEDITEPRMCENCDFAVPVDILTLFVHTPFSWSTQHATVNLDSTKFIALMFTCNVLYVVNILKLLIRFQWISCILSVSWYHSLPLPLSLCLRLYETVLHLLLKVRHHLKSLE